MIPAFPCHYCYMELSVIEAKPFCQCPQEKVVLTVWIWDSNLYLKAENWYIQSVVSLSFEKVNICFYFRDCSLFCLWGRGEVVEDLKGGTHFCTQKLGEVPDLHKFEGGYTTFPKSHNCSHCTKPTLNTKYQWILLKNHKHVKHL